LASSTTVWVFPGLLPGKPLVPLWHVWHFVRDRAGLGKDARLYDLRHSLASVGAGGGLSLPIIGRLLGQHPKPHDGALCPSGQLRVARGGGADRPARPPTASKAGAEIVPMPKEMIWRLE
jgi:hypothetical protein